MPRLPRTYVVVPAYNEANRIAEVVRCVPAHVAQIVVVDDASSDDSASVLRSLATDSRFVVVRHAANRGVGAAIVTGYQTLLASGGEANDAFVVMAGDGQMRPDDLERVAEPVLRGRADYVKGERFSHPAVRRVMPASRYWAGRAFSLLTALAVGQPVHDSQCGYTAIGRAVCARLDLAGLWPGFGYPNDVLAHLASRGARIHEVQVTPSYPHAHNKLRFHHVPLVAFVIARAAFRRHTLRQSGDPPSD